MILNKFYPVVFAALIIVGISGCGSDSEKAALLEKIPEVEIDMPLNSLDQIFKQLELAEEHYTAYRVHPENKGYVPATFTIREKEFDVSVKIKGGIGHYSRDKYSLRVRVKDEDPILNMYEFSIQDPAARDTLTEWVFQRMLRHAGLPSMEMTWLRGTINGEEKGIYIVQEFFHRDLGKKNGLPQGVFFGFDADSLWLARKESMTSKYEDIFNTAPLKVYDKKTVNDSPALQNDYANAQEFMNGYRSRNMEAADVLNVDQLAKLFAIVNLMGDTVYHSCHLYNLRFYYSAELGTISPMAYDHENIFPIDGLKFRETFDGLLKGYVKLAKNMEMFNWLFQSKEFQSAYLNALSEICTPNWVNGFFTSIDKDLADAEAMVGLLYPKYSFAGSRAVIENNAKVIASALGTVNLTFETDSSITAND